MKIEEIRETLEELDKAKDQLLYCEEALDILEQPNAYVKSINFRYITSDTHKETFETMEFYLSVTLANSIKAAITQERNRTETYINTLKKRLEGEE